MVDQDPYKTDTTELDGSIEQFSVESRTLDEETSESGYTNPKFEEYLGYYKKIPELKQAIDSLARWACGRGYDCNALNKPILEHWTGWGEDTFDSIMMNMIIMKKINGDSFAEIIKEKNVVINLKPVNPSKIRIVVNKKGFIDYYEEIDPKSKKAKRRFEKEEIFHLCNNRVGSEHHGVSMVESVKDIIDMRNEAMESWRRVLKRSSVRVIYVDLQDDETIAKLKDEYKEAIDNGEAMIVPGKKGEVEVVDYPTPNATPYLETIRYYENVFYLNAGVPKAILGGTQDFSEASSKMAVFTFDQVWMTEQRILEQDIWNQLGMKVAFKKPDSIKDTVVSSEAANTGQMGIQPKEVSTGGLNRE